MDVPRLPRARRTRWSAVARAAALAVALLIAGAAPPARADEAADRAAVDALLAKVTAPAAGPERLAAAEKLREAAPRLWAAMGAALGRTRASSLDERRAVLRVIGAAIPDADGKFAQPKRQKTSEIKADDEVDWLAALVALDPNTPAPPPEETKAATKKKDKKDAKEEDAAPEAAPPPATLSAVALADVLSDVALIRALAASHVPAAAAPVFDAGFRDDTMIYRDECGRYLRKMEPHSIPVLTVESQSSGDRRRYATYQLERLDRQEPGKALAAATSDEGLLIAIFDAFRKTKLREAVYAVFAYIDHDSPRVRAAARETWLGYVTGKAPPDAPKRKMVLPGGKLAEKETPMWLTYRELADEKLRKASEELLGEPIGDDAKINVEALSRRIFDHYDAIRTKREAEQWTAARSLAASGDVAGAVARLDQLLAVNPDRADRAEMAEVYLTHGKAMQQAEKWSEAAAAFSTAVGLAPDGAHAKDAIAARDFALGKAMEKDGKDGTGLYRRAAVAQPSFEAAAEAAGDAPRPRWMLYVASMAGLIAIALAAFAVSRRRRMA